MIDMDWPLLDRCDTIRKPISRVPVAMISLTVSADTPQVSGFSHLWAKYVMGFDPTVHCMNCLIGHRSTLITRTMPSAGARMEMTETRRFDFLYICGVTRSWSTNFHLVLRLKLGARAEARSYNGITFAAQDAEAIDIPWLADGYCALPAAFTTCRNYQFGEAVYGIRGARSIDAA